MKKLTTLSIAAGAILALTSGLTHSQTRSESAASSAMTQTNRVSEQSTPAQSQGSKPRPSRKSRADVKAGAVAATHGGSPVMGEASTPGQSKGSKPRPSEKARADVKAEAAAANRPMSDKAKGESSQKDQDKGVTKP